MICPCLPHATPLDSYELTRGAGPENGEGGYGRLQQNTSQHPPHTNKQQIGLHQKKIFTKSPFFSGQSTKRGKVRGFPLRKNLKKLVFLFIICSSFDH